jgi:hypothetical protein
MVVPSVEKIGNGREDSLDLSSTLKTGNLEEVFKSAYRYLEEYPLTAGIGIIPLRKLGWEDYVMNEVGRSFCRQFSIVWGHIWAWKL